MVTLQAATTKVTFTLIQSVEYLRTNPILTTIGGWGRKRQLIKQAIWPCHRPASKQWSDHKEYPAKCKDTPKAVWGATTDLRPSKGFCWPATWPQNKATIYFQNTDSRKELTEKEQHFMMQWCQNVTATFSPMKQGTGWLKNKQQTHPRTPPWMASKLHCCDFNLA